MSLVPHARTHVRPSKGQRCLPDVMVGWFSLGGLFQHIALREASALPQAVLTVGSARAALPALCRATGLVLRAR